MTEPRREYRCLAFTMFGQIEERFDGWHARIWVSSQPLSVVLGVPHSSEVRRMPDEHMPNYSRKCDSKEQASTELDLQWGQMTQGFRDSGRTEPQFKEVG